MKMSDFIVNFLEENGVDSCFAVSGGAVLHIVDSISKSTKIRMIFSQHEQAAASGADAYSRISPEKTGFCLATSGPGATNLLTGVSNAFFDSIPLLCITGNVSTFREKTSLELRQYGFQETNIVGIFSHITKFAFKLKDPKDIKWALGKALYEAKNGRPGPVLIDIPDNLQRVEVNDKELTSFFPPSPSFELKKEHTNNWSCFLENISSALADSKRPLILLGAGARISNCFSEIRSFLEVLNVPVLLSWGAKDIFASDHPLNFGGFGVCGPRVGNLAIQEADLLLVIGCRLNQMQIGADLKNFAPKSKKFMIDIDVAEVEKFDGTGLSVTDSLIINIKDFVRNFRLTRFLNEDWYRTLNHLRNTYTIEKEISLQNNNINAYEFINLLSKKIADNSIVLTDAGGNLCWTMQGFATKSNQRLISAWNHSPMGFSLPAAIGAALARPDEIIYCIIGDGGIMMCLEELATIARHKLKIKVFIFNNRGHGIQKQTIENWFDGHYVGVDYETGLYFPDFAKVAEGFDLCYQKVSEQDNLDDFFGSKEFVTDSPMIFDVQIDPNQRIQPMIKSGSFIDLDPKM
jgi:acetolactate synthase-1/2/3 large subunit